MALSERAQQQRERVRHAQCPGCGSADLREGSAWCIECESDLVHRYFSRLGKPCPAWACAHRHCRAFNHAPGQRQLWQETREDSDPVDM